MKMVYDAIAHAPYLTKHIKLEIKSESIVSQKWTPTYAGVHWNELDFDVVLTVRICTVMAWISLDIKSDFRRF